MGQQLLVQYLLICDTLRFFTFVIIAGVKPSAPVDFWVFVSRKKWKTRFGEEIVHAPLLKYPEEGVTGSISINGCVWIYKLENNFAFATTAAHFYICAVSGQLLAYRNIFFCKLKVEFKRNQTGSITCYTFVSYILHDHSFVFDPGENTRQPICERKWQRLTE